jgi:hypothetical protein
MHNISPNIFNFDRPDKKALSLRQAIAQSPRRTVDLAQDNSFVKLISCSLLHPTRVFIQDSSLGKLYVVKVGFTLDLPPNVDLLWVRFTVGVTPVVDSAAQGQPTKIVSLYPTRVDRGINVHGRIIVHEDGELKREHTVLIEHEETAECYYPRLLGWQVAAEQVIWDWVPATKKQPLGSNALFLSVVCPDNAIFRCTRSVNLAVRSSNSIDVIVLEVPAETAEAMDAAPNV